MRAFLLVVLLCCFGVARAENFTLVYHHIGVQKGVTLGVTADELERRIHQLLDAGYRFVTSSQTVNNRRGQKTVTLRFDDGFEDVFLNAYPVLKRLNVPGTVYPILDLIGHPGHMTHDQIAQLVADGWEVGSHTRSHASLADLTPSSLAWELLPDDSHRYACIAYPFGRHDARVRRKATSLYGCGGTVAFGVRVSDPHALQGPLITPWDDSVLMLRAAGGYDLRSLLLLGSPLVTALDQRGTNAHAPRFWHPSGFEMLGSGFLAYRWVGAERSHQLFARSRQVALNAAFVRGEGAYDALAIAVNTDPVTLSWGWSNRGPLLGAALALGGYGEVWARYDGNWGVGADLCLVDYTRIQAEVDSIRGGAADVSYALPWNTREGRPWRVSLGHDAGFYVGSSMRFVGSSMRFGSFELSARVHPTQRRFGIGISSMW